MAGNLLPLLFLGGAAVVLSKKKKKKKSKSSKATPSAATFQRPPYSPAALPAKAKKSGSGYSNVTRERMQWIQTTLGVLGYDVGPKGMDGKYGKDTKAAVWAFQQDHVADLGEPDGKPGKNTQALLASVLEGRSQAQSQGEYPKDECDPIDPSTWGAGNLCVLEGSRWMKVKEGKDAPAPSKPAPKEPAVDLNAVPTPKSNEVAFNANLTDFEIGSVWTHGALANWLLERRNEGLLETKNKKAWLYVDQYSVGQSIEHWYEIAMGTIVYTGILVGGGVLLAVNLPVAIGAGAAAIAGFGTSLAVAEAWFLPVFHDAQAYDRARETGALAFKEFVETQSVVVGPDRQVIKIKDLKRTKALVEFLQVVIEYIARFQKSSQ